MKLPFALALLALLVTGLGDAHAATGTTTFSPANRILIIDPSSMPVDGGKATLTIGALHWAGGVYSGGYKIKVSPYFFKSEKGRLAIIVSDESLAEIGQGMATSVVGTATTSGNRGIRRHIDAVVTPDDANHGTLKVWFMAGDRKMIFRPAYHLSEKLTSDVAGSRVETNLASNFPHEK
jgi:hypothetical protein